MYVTTDMFRREYVRLFAHSSAGRKRHSGSTCFQHRLFAAWAWPFPVLIAAVQVEGSLHIFLFLLPREVTVFQPKPVTIAASIGIDVGVSNQSSHEYPPAVVTLAIIPCFRLSANGLIAFPLLASVLYGICASQGRVCERIADCQSCYIPSRCGARVALASSSPYNQTQPRAVPSSTGNTEDKR